MYKILAKMVQNIDQKGTKRKRSFAEIEKSSIFRLVEKVQHFGQKSTKYLPKKYKEENILY